MIVVIGTAAAAAEHSTPFAPASKWQMDYAPAECRLLRTVAAGKDRLTVQLSRLDVDDAVELSLAGERLPSTDDYVAATVGTSTVAQVPGMGARGFAAARGSPGTIRFGAAKDLAVALRADAAANQPTRLSVGLARRYRVQIDLGPMKGPIAALDTCMDDLVTSWGLDPTEQRQRRSAPEAASAPATWFNANDFPGPLGRAGLGGIVVTRLLVGSDGAVKTCTVAKAGGDKVFEDLTCRSIVARARFRPAVGSGGQPIASVWIRRIVWEPARPFFSRPD